jgi:glycosyltransferase involved in cell wall biosynthesis
MVDVCLVLEGTYPFRTGGVSTWTHDLITGLPHLRFAVVHLYAGPPPSDPRFVPPANLAAVSIRPVGGDLLCPDLAELEAGLPPARLYHALSTGPAGLLGAAAGERRRVPFVLTEHGIYWHEAAQDGRHLECGAVAPESDGSGRPWAEVLRAQARRAYAAAAEVVTVCAANHAMQRAAGAPPAKCFVIPNGVDLPAPPPTRAGRPRRAPRVALVGRVTPLKATADFVRACAILDDVLPAARCFVLGPLDHSPEYAAECRALAARLGVHGLTFGGEVDVRAWYPTLDVVVLTSRSEAQPLVLLEAMAHGCPVVATDVGGCRELVEGAGDGFGPAGVVCPPGDPGAIARAVCALAGGPRAPFARAGRRRVETHYTRRALLERYAALYARHLAAGPALTSA